MACQRRIKIVISIHAPLTGSDDSSFYTLQASADFNPRSPYGERRKAGMQPLRRMEISIHAPLTGSDLLIVYCSIFVLISIHAPLTGSDPIRIRLNAGRVGISIHAPLTGSDRARDINFQIRKNFNPRSPYGERRTEADCRRWCEEFQSTLPLRGATFRGFLCLDCHPISIHAPLTGSDQAPLPARPRHPISIHAPLTGSDCWIPISWPAQNRFQSTLPLRGATYTTKEEIATWQFQSTLPLRGATFADMPPILGQSFQSTLPLRGATDSVCAGIHEDPFQSTLPLRGATKNIR